VGNGKNIRTRKKIRDALSGMPGRFNSHDMSAATGLSARRVHGLLKTMDEVFKVRVGARQIVWIVKPGVVVGG